MTKQNYDLQDGKIHIRARADAPCAAPVLCGKTGQASITEAWGFWGPGGKGFDDVCADCYAKRDPKRGAA